MRMERGTIKENKSQYPNLELYSFCQSVYLTVGDDEGDDGDAHQDDPGQAEQQERLGK